MSPEEASYLEELHERPVDEIEHSRMRRTLIAPAVLILVNGVLTPWFLLEQYLRPYQAATGQLLPDGSINIYTGEFVVVASWVGIWTVLGIFSIWYIRRSYSPSAPGPA